MEFWGTLIFKDTEVPTKEMVKKWIRSGFQKPVKVLQERELQLHKILLINQYMRNVN